MNKHTAALLEQHFDTAFAAPGGIKKLRELILTLAMQGKLVPQNPNDSPASELLRSIEAEKKRLVKEGKIKAPKPLPPVSEDEKPYELPRGWEWVRFGSITEIERGGSPRPIKSFLTDDADGLNWIKIGDTAKGGKYITSASEKIRREGLSKTRMVYPGDFLLTNSMSFGRPYITKIEGCIHDGWLRISSPDSLEKDYLYSLLSSPFIRKQFEVAAAGAVVLNLNADKVRDLPIPLPPLPEQHRIVAKIDELMDRCDALEKLRTAQNEKRLTVHAATIGQLLNIAEPEQHQRAQNFLAEHFGDLYTVKANVTELRKAILQLAVMGKVVPQDPNDPPASELLKDIEAEKKRLVKEGKIKAPKPLPPVSEDEKPYELPRGWEWVRVRAIGYDLGQKTPDTRFTYIDVGSIDSKAGLVGRDVKVLEPQDAPSRARKIVRRGTVIYSTVRPYLQNIAIVQEEYVNEAIASTAFAILYPFAGVDNHFVYYYLRSPIFIKYVEGTMKGVAYPAINDGDFFQGFFPLPPAQEQHRIVAKIDQLMALCDTLEQQIDDANRKQTELLDAVVAQV